jgi:hypothetical protein
MLRLKIVWFSAIRRLYQLPHRIDWRLSQPYRMASSQIASKLTSRSAWDGTRTTRKYNGGSNWTATSMYRSTDVNAVASPGMETYQGYKTQDVRWPTRLKSGGVHKVDVEYRLCLVRFCFHFFIPAKKIWGPVWILLIRLNWIRFQRSVYLIAHGIESLILIHFHSITKTTSLSWSNSFPTLRWGKWRRSSDARQKDDHHCT